MEWDSLQVHCVPEEAKIGQDETEYGYAYRLQIWTERFGVLEYAYRKILGAAADIGQKVVRYIYLSG